jgi:hypothetical protein
MGSRSIADQVAADPLGALMADRGVEQVDWRAWRAIDAAWMNAAVRSASARM